MLKAAQLTGGNTRSEHIATLVRLRRRLFQRRRRSLPHRPPIRSNNSAPFHTPAHTLKTSSPAGLCSVAGSSSTLRNHVGRSRGSRITGILAQSSGVIVLALVVTPVAAAVGAVNSLIDRKTDRPRKKRSGSRLESIP